MVEMKNLGFSYTKSTAGSLEDISLHVPEGEAVALIGLSGCGKTTLTRIINGLAYKFYGGKITGSVTVDGENPREKELYEIGRKVGSIFQNPKNQFFAERVEDEIAFGLENHGVRREEILQRMDEALSAMNGKNLMGKSLFRLSDGERQKVAIASIYALNPPIYVFDEPSANLDIKSTESLKELLLSLKKAGKTIILSEHRIYYLRGIVDRYVYMEKGRVIRFYGEKELLAKDRDYYLQSGLRACRLDTISSNAVQQKGRSCLRIENLSFSYNKADFVFEGLNYTFVSGDIYGIIGDNGVGKSTLSRVLSGLNREKCGAVFYNDSKLTPSARRKKIYYLSNNPDSSLFEVTPADELRLNDPEVKADEILSLFHLEDVKDKHPQILSGGQKQRLTIASAELLERDVYIFDEPTSGLDGKNMRLIAERMKGLQKRGKIVILISHDYEFLMESCSRILYLNGRGFLAFSAETDSRKILETLRGGEEPFAGGSGKILDGAGPKRLY